MTTLLAELPAEFKEGSSFLNLCITKDGKLWTSPYMPCMFEQCEQLAVMAIGLGLMEYCSLKKLWVFLPGGVPYLIIITLIIEYTVKSKFYYEDFLYNRKVILSYYIKNCNCF